MNKKIKCFKLILLLILPCLVIAKNDDNFNKFNELKTQHYKTYFKYETCVEYLFYQTNLYTHILNHNKSPLLHSLKHSKKNNQKLLYKKIDNQCLLNNSEFPIEFIKQHPRRDYLNYNFGTSKLDKIVAKILCNAQKNQKDSKCEAKITNQELDLIIRSKENYIHEQVQNAHSKIYNRYLSKHIAKHIKTQHLGLANDIYHDAQLLYQCSIGKDCSSTSYYMIEKCIYNQEFCGLDVDTYLRKYKTSSAQFEQIKQAFDFLSNY